MAPTAFPLRQIHKSLFLSILFSLGMLLSFGQESGPLDTDIKCLAYIDSSEQYLERNLELALAYADSSYGLYDQTSSDSVKISILINLGDVYMEIPEMDQALKYYLKAKQLLQEAQLSHPDDLKIAIAHIDLRINIGVLNYHQGNYDKSLTQYEEALRSLEDIINEAATEEIATRKIRLFNNLAGIYIENSDYDTALAYYQNALEINQPTGNKRYEALLENNIGICYVEKGEFDLANHHFLKALGLHKELDNKRGEAQTLNSIGKNQASKGNFVIAKNYFEEALLLGNEIGNGRSILISLESLSLVYDTLGNYKRALDTFRKYKTLNDSIFSSENQTAIAKLEDAFKRDQEKKIFELQVQAEKTERQKLELRNLKIGALLLSLLLLATIFIIYMRGKIKNGKLQQQKLKLEHENLELERHTLQESIAYKDRELTANALFLIKNNELISKISEKLLQARDTFKVENQKIIQDIIIELRSSQDTHLWNEFEAHFTRVHSDFYQKLQEQYPNLTANEKKLCAFLRLNMSTKDISAITYQSVNSITVARSRLRKKLNIEGEDIQLVNFLMDF